MEILNPKQESELCDAVITPSMWYGAGTWTLTNEHEEINDRPYEKEVKSTENKQGKMGLTTKEATMDCPLGLKTAKAQASDVTKTTNAPLESGTDDDTNGADEDIED